MLSKTSSLKDDVIRFLFSMRLATKLNRIRRESLNEMYEDFKIWVHEAANEALGEVIALENGSDFVHI